MLIDRLSSSFPTVIELLIFFHRPLFDFRDLRGLGGSLGLREEGRGRLNVSFFANDDEKIRFGRGDGNLRICAILFFSENERYLNFLSKKRRIFKNSKLKNSTKTLLQFT